MNLFTRARKGLDLMPIVRVKVAALAAVVTAVPAMAQVLAQDSFRWSAVHSTGAAAFATAFPAGFTKYNSAQRDTPRGLVAAPSVPESAATGASAEGTAL